MVRTDVKAAVDARIAELEVRLQQQDEALRRVLQLLVDWVEADGPPARRADAA